MARAAAIEKRHRRSGQQTRRPTNQSASRRKWPSACRMDFSKVHVGVSAFLAFPCQPSHWATQPKPIKTPLGSCTWNMPASAPPTPSHSTPGYSPHHTLLSAPFPVLQSVEPLIARPLAAWHSPWVNKNLPAAAHHNNNNNTAIATTSDHPLLPHPRTLHYLPSVSSKPAVD